MVAYNITIPDSVTIILDMSFVRVLESWELQPKLDTLKSLLFAMDIAIVSSSRKGISVSGTKKKIEELFQTSIEVSSKKTVGGIRGPENTYELSFSSAPVIPDSLTTHISTVQVPSSALPLENKPFKKRGEQ